VQGSGVVRCMGHLSRRDERFQKGRKFKIELSAADGTKMLLGGWAGDILLCSRVLPV
jgi:hypothetical protein